jgi:hypothetical protein
MPTARECRHNAEICLKLARSRGTRSPIRAMLDPLPTVPTAAAGAPDLLQHDCAPRHDCAPPRERRLPRLSSKYQNMARYLAQMSHGSTQDYVTAGGGDGKA